MGVLTCLSLYLFFSFPLPLEPKCILQQSEVNGYIQDGDVILGGIFPLHLDDRTPPRTFTEPPITAACQRFSFRSFRWVLAFLFAVEELNGIPGALPNLTLRAGVIDSCSSTKRTLSGTAWYLSGGPERPINYQCWGPPPRLAAILGDAGPESALNMAHLTSLYKYPQISYFTPPPELSNRHLFASSLSVAPSLSYQAKGLVRLLQTFGWSWVGVLSQEGSLSDVGKAFLNELDVSSICLAFWENVPSSVAEVTRISTVIRRSTANVVIVFSLEAYLNPVLTNLAQIEVNKDIIWLSTEAWSTSPRLVNPLLSRFLKGSLGLVLRNGAAPGFKEFIFGLRPSKFQKDPFLREFWEEAFGCKWSENKEPDKFPTSNSTISYIPSSISSSFPYNKSLNSLVYFDSSTFYSSSSIHAAPISSTPSPSYAYTSMFASSLSPPSSSFTSKLPSSSTSISSSSTSRPSCTGLEDPASLQIFSDIDDLRVTYNVYKAVRMVAGALKDMANCLDGERMLSVSSCVNIHHFLPWQFLHYLRKVRLKGNVGDELYFDSFGNAPAVYDIINWQHNLSVGYTWKWVGSYESGVPPGRDLMINYSAIQWGKDIEQLPSSVCSNNCTPGFWKAPRQWQPPCCFDCIPCSAGEISNLTDSTECFLCPDDQWPNAAHDQCIPRTVELLSFTEPLGISLGTTSIVSSILPAVVLLLFVRNRDTPLVRANNRTLSFLLLAALVLSFLCPLLLLAPPGPQLCLVRQAVFGVSFTLCISCILSKTLIVVIAFRANKPDGCLKVLMGPRWPVLIALFSTALQLLLCICWITLSPPFPEKDGKSKLGKLIIQCNEGLGFWLMLGYLGLLSTICFGVAFLARKLPGVFNEATHITFSMLVFLSVWVSFVPAYLSTRGMFALATEIFAIISSSAGLLLCIFLPKCYIILLQPHLNTRASVSGHQVRHLASHQRCFPSSQRRISTSQ